MYNQIVYIGKTDCLKLRQSVFLVSLDVEINLRFYRRKIKSFSMRKPSWYNSKRFGHRITKNISWRFLTMLKNNKNEIKSTAHSKYRWNTPQTVWIEGSRDTGSRSMSWPYTYAGKYSAVFKYSTIHGISQGKKLVNDIW